MGKKLMQRRIGPFVVQECINDNVYRLHIPDTYLMNPTINIEHLRPYREAPAEAYPGITRPLVPDPRQSELLASEEYEVEDIVTWRRNKSRWNRIEFLVRWKGYGPEDDTWQTPLDLQNAPRILRDYVKSHPDVPVSL